MQDEQVLVLCEEELPTLSDLQEIEENANLYMFAKTNSAWQCLISLCLSQPLGAIFTRLVIIMLVAVLVPAYRHTVYFAVYSYLLLIHLMVNEQTEFYNYSWEFCIIWYDA